MIAALRESTVEVGRALVFTSLALGAGFATLMTADFVGTYYFGLLCVMTIAFALGADLLLLPIVLRWYATRREPQLDHSESNACVDLRVQSSLQTPHGGPGA